MSYDNFTFGDKLLPVQPHMREYFESTEEFIQALGGAINAYCHLQSPGNELNLKLTEAVSVDLMASSPLVLRLLQILVQVTRANYVLEIGAFIGVSAMYMAQALPPGGRLVTIEKFRDFAAIATENARMNGLSDRIQIIEGDAFKVLKGLDRQFPFDLIFLDGNKERYSDYFSVLDDLLRPGRLLVVDDVLFQGDVLNDVPRTEKGRGVKAFLQAAEVSGQYKTVILPVANGVMLMYKCV